MFRRGTDSHKSTCAPPSPNMPPVTMFSRLVGKMGPITFALSCGNDIKMKRMNEVEGDKKSKKMLNNCLIYLKSKIPGSCVGR